MGTYGQTHTQHQASRLIQVVVPTAPSSVPTRRNLVKPKIKVQTLIFNSNHGGGSSSPQGPGNSLLVTSFVSFFCILQIYSDIIHIPYNHSFKMYTVFSIFIGTHPSPI